MAKDGHTYKLGKTYLGNPVPDDMPLPGEATPAPAHINREALDFRVKALTSEDADFTEAELEEMHGAWKKIFSCRGTKEAAAQVKLMTCGIYRGDAEIHPLLESRCAMWAKTEWSPNMPEDLRVPRKDFQGELEGIAAFARKKGFLWLDEYREWLRWDKKKNAYLPLENQAEVMKAAYEFIDRQTHASDLHPEIAADTDLQRLLTAMRGAKSQIEGRLRELLNANIAQFQKAEYYELCTPAGTYDLRTGELIRKNNGLTMTVTDAAPDFDWDHWEKSAWKELLEQDLPEPEKRDYLQRAIGFSLYGELPYGQDPLLHMWQGPRGAGKSQIFNDINKALGSYGIYLDIKVFTNSMDDIRKQHEKALMFGKRLAIAPELEQSEWLSADTLKDIVSTDPIHAEEKYHKAFDFTNTCSVHMMTNYLPQIKNIDDMATQRRIRVCKFWKTFVNPDGTPNGNVTDPTLPGRAKEELGIILAWAIRGAMKFAKDGFILAPPEIIKKETREYFGLYDWIGLFLETECEIGEDTQEDMVPLSSLFIRFSKWCELGGHKLYSMNNVQFSKRLRSKSEQGAEYDGLITLFKRGRDHTTMVAGLRLRTNTDAAAAVEKQIYGNDAPEINLKADLDDVLAAAEEKAEEQKTEADRDLKAIDHKELGRVIDERIPVERQKEMGRRLGMLDTCERAVKSALDARDPKTLKDVSLALHTPPTTPLTPEQEALLYITWAYQKAVFKDAD